VAINLNSVWIMPEAMLNFHLKVSLLIFKQISAIATDLNIICKKAELSQSLPCDARYI